MATRIWVYGPALIAVFEAAMTMAPTIAELGSSPSCYPTCEATRASSSTRIGLSALGRGRGLISLEASFEGVLGSNHLSESAWTAQVTQLMDTLARPVRRRIPGPLALAADEAPERDARPHHAVRLACPNVLVVGPVGVGKSTLVNAIFGKSLSATGSGAPVTSHVMRFEDPDVPISLYDTPGLSLDHRLNDELNRHSKEIIARSRKGPPDEHIDLAWYCIDPSYGRLDRDDVEVVRALATELPVILVFTRVIDDAPASETEAAVRAAALLVVNLTAVRTLAQPRTIGKFEFGVRGLDELMRMTTDIAAMR
jgi:GTP-binding protein EngB required for normal cell division